MGNDTNSQNIQKPAQGSNQANTKANPNTIVPLVIFAVIALCALLIATYIIYTVRNPKMAEVTPPSGLSAPSNYPTQNPPTPTTLLTVVPKKLDCSAQMAKVIQNPTIKGDAPDKGMYYVEFDLSVLCKGDTPGPIQGTFYYKDASGTYYTADAQISGAKYANKKITIPGKTSVHSTIFKPGQSEDNVYLIYEVKTGTKGTLEWYNPFAKGNQWQNLYFFID